MTELCCHGRVLGHVCLECSSGVATCCQLTDAEPYDPLHSDDYIIDLEKEVVRVPDVERPSTGLDAPYYDFPANVNNAQGLIEYLGLNFANGNIMKSLIRQYGSQTKSTDALYEAEKRYYFAKREYEKVRRDYSLQQIGKAHV